MPVRMFTQSAIVLLDRPVESDAVEAALATFDLVERKASMEPSWSWAAETLIYAWRPEVNGYVVVDVVDRPWPDNMGDPKTNQDLFGAWATGGFGPLVFPGSLKRAVAQSWGCPEAKQFVPRHKAFVRVRSSYVLGAAGNDPVVPEDYAPLPELEHVTEMALAALATPGALCYFNPNGETLHTTRSAQPIRAHFRGNGLPAVNLWSNVRLWNFDEAPNGWSMFDSIGMGQLDVADHEACFQRSRYEANDVAEFVRNSTIHIASNGPVVKDGETMDGANVRWQGRHFKNAIVDPPRPVLRFLPMDGTKPPARLMREE